MKSIIVTFAIIMALYYTACHIALTFPIASTLLMLTCIVLFIAWLMDDRNETYLFNSDKL